MRLGWCNLKQNRRPEHCKLQFDQISKRYHSPSVYLASLTTLAVLHFKVGVTLLKMATVGPRQSLKQGKQLHSQLL